VPARFREEYDAQLPKLPRVTLERAINIIGAITSIAGLVAVFVEWDRLSTDIRFAISLSYLSVLLIFSILFSWLRGRKKLGRYAQAIFYLHFINHIVRDHLAEARLAEKPTIPADLLGKIIDSINACFSLLSGHQCRARIIQIEDNLSVRTVTCDSITRTWREPTIPPETISKNTPLYNIWSGEWGCTRYYLCFNSKTEWRKHRFDSPDFAFYGEPTAESICGFTSVKGWQLPYRSVLVVPIRFIPETVVWPVSRRPGPGAAAPGDVPYVWGFLWIDCATKKVFDRVYSPELCAAFADVLHMLFSQIDHLSANKMIEPK